MSKDDKVNLLPAFGDWWNGQATWLEMVSVARETNQSMDTHVIYVLEDGETYSGEPTIAVKVSDAELEEIENGSKVYNVVPDWETRGVK